MKVSKYKVGRRRFISLVDDFDIPVYPLANAYLYDSFGFASFATLERVAWELMFVLEYFEHVGIDLINRIRTCEFLSSHEISDFYFASRVRKKHFANLKKITIIPSVENKSLRNSITQSVTQKSKVSLNTCSGRVRRLRHFIEFVYCYYYEGVTPSANQISSYNATLRKLKMRETISQGPNAPKTLTLDDSVIPNKIFDQLIQIINPLNEKNPFTNGKFRNYLIISILIQTGIRRSEVCKLKISDCQFFSDASRLKIYSTSNDRDDPRLNRPNKKSGRGHISGIEPSLMKELLFYIKEIRSQFPESRTHDFVFVAEGDSKSSAGLPITRELVNYMLKRVSKLLNFNIHPHLLRHKWNERLSESGNAKGIDRERLEDMRRNAMGWSPRSNMGDVYNTKHQQIRAIEVILNHQEEVDGKRG